MKINRRGFSAVEALLLLVLVGIIGGTGWYVWNTKTEADNTLQHSSSSLSETEKKAKNTLTDIPAGDYATFTVTASQKLPDKGSCKTGEVIFAPIFNSESFDYDCNSLESALGYASVVFGKSDKAVEQLFKTTKVSPLETVNLSSGLKVSKLTFESQVKGHGVDTTHAARHTLYQVTGKAGVVFYAIHRAHVGAADENHTLDGFTDLVQNNWEIK